MLAVAQTIQEGARAYLNRQYTTIAILAVVVAVVISLAIGAFEKFPEVARFKDNTWTLGLMTGFAFLVGAAASALSGIIGMWIAVKSNARVASAARQGVGQALDRRARGGASPASGRHASLIGVFSCSCSSTG
jgi:K(+)-stimulated pyrophosphate-energized sodium pump